MIKKTVRRIADSKIFYVIISILASIFLWLYVVRVENADIVKTITDIPVNFVGKDDILADRGLLISGEDEQTVSITFSGPRNIVSKYDKNNVHVNVDLTEVKNVAVIERYYLDSVEVPEGIIGKNVNITKYTPQYVTVNIDKLMSKSIPIKGILSGSVAEGYVYDSFQFNPETIDISGPEAIVSKISVAEVTIKRENLQDTIVEQSNYVFKDEKGNEIKTDDIKTNVNTVESKLVVLMIKEVALAVDLIPGGGAEKENTKVIIEPSIITLSGDRTLLEGINKLSIGTVNLAEVSDTLIESMTIPIPNGVKNLSGETTAKVSVKIIGLTTKVLTKELSGNIEFINVPEGYRAEIVQQTPLYLTVRGPASEVEKVGAHNIRIVFDLSEMSQVTGKASFEPLIYIDGFKNVGVVSNYEKVYISLEDKAAD